jgi:uncharacterized protein GlcG (DUF336 family)
LRRSALVSSRFHEQQTHPHRSPTCVPSPPPPKPKPQANGWAVTIAIVDDGGHLLWLQRLDGAAPISAEIAPAKARTAALGRRESKVYEDMINQGRMSFLSAPALQACSKAGCPSWSTGSAWARWA